MIHKYYMIDRKTLPTHPPADNVGGQMWGTRQTVKYLWPNVWGYKLFADRLPFQTVQNDSLYPDNPAEALCYRAWQEYHAEAEGFLEEYFSSYDDGELWMMAVENEDFWADMILAYEIGPKQVENIFIEESMGDE